MAQLALAFLATQLLGLYVAGALIREGVQATIVSEDPNDVANAFGLIAYILVGTAVVLAVILLLHPRHSRWLMRLMETLAVLGTSLIVFSTFLPSDFALGATVLLLGFKLVYAKSLLWRNVSSAIATAGVGALLGVSLGVLPVIVFMVLLSLYDFIAVFKTKHMVVMAKAMSAQNLAFTFALPTPEHVFELGTGDLVVPLSFSVAVFKAAAWTHAFPLNWLAAIAVLGASLLGLMLTIEFVSKRVGTALPALPLQSAFMIASYGLLLAVGF